MKGLEDYSVEFTQDQEYFLFPLIIAENLIIHRILDRVVQSVLLQSAAKLVSD